MWFHEALFLGSQHFHNACYQPLIVGPVQTTFHTVFIAFLSQDLNPPWMFSNILDDSDTSSSLGPLLHFPKMSGHSDPPPMTTVASDPAGVSPNKVSRGEGQETGDEVVIATIDKREPLVTRKVSVVVGLHLSCVLIKGPGIVELLLYVPSPNADLRICLSSTLFVPWKCIITETM